MSNENMNAIVEARLTAAADAEARLTGLFAQVGEALADLRTQVSGAQLAHMRVYETPPQRRASDAPRPAGPLTFDAADKVRPSNWPPHDPMEQLP